ncbi:MAG: T9SS type A sorting domain-containing protein [Candidatus Cloacimonadota bacterium]|nr:MAG: T9SS type A sorting domain-containing protein [Candidatus Cloacimonadota bacterium]
MVDSNNIYNNGYGAYNADNSQLLMAEYNWWGHSSGPYHTGLNPSGLGDSTNMWVDPVPFLTDSLLGITEVVKRQKPSVSMVKQNYPNPFKRETIIRYHCSEPSKITIKVYNLLGQEVAILVDRVENAGEHIVKWDASELSNGIYFYKVTIGNFTETRKCMVVK